jgi:hypothetical protein
VSAKIIPDYEKALGGEDEEIIYDVIDGGSGASILVGETNSMGSGDKDAYLLKIDYFGDIVWNRTYGGLYTDGARAGIKSEEGGYVIVGKTTSYDAQDEDVYLIKVTSSGNEEWHSLIGGGGSDWGESVVETKDWYVILGSTQMSSLHTFDIYVIKLDKFGEVNKTKKFGGAGNDFGKSIINLDDGGFLVLASLENPKTLTSDIYLIKIDEDLNHQWNRTFGENFHDQPSSLVKTSDGGYIISGTRKNTNEQYDIFILKLDSDFNIKWFNTYGGMLDEHGFSCIESADGDLFVVGRTSETDGSELDIIFYELDAYGNVLLSETFGTSFSDYGMSTYETNYNDLVIAGYTKQNRDAYVVRLRQNWLNLESEYGELNGDSLYLFGEDATFSISPTLINIDEGTRMSFMGWESNDIIGYNGQAEKYSINMTQEVSETAIWEKQFRVEAFIEMGKGEFTGTGWYKEGSRVDIIATPDEDYSFLDWEGTYVDVNNKYESQITLVVDKPIDLKARFQLNGTYYLQVISEYGEVSGTDYYAKGSKAFFSVEPEIIPISSTERISFSGWKSEKDGGYIGPDNHASVQINEDIIEIATWKTQFLVSVSGPKDTGLNNWYDQGEEINIPVIVEGTILRKKLVIYNEEGNVVEGLINVNRPLNFTSKWKTDYTLLYATVFISVLVLIGVFYFMKKRG